MEDKNETVNGRTREQYIAFAASTFTRADLLASLRRARISGYRLQTNEQIAAVLWQIAIKD